MDKLSLRATEIVLQIIQAFRDTDEQYFHNGEQPVLHAQIYDVFSYISQAKVLFIGKFSNEDFTAYSPQWGLLIKNPNTPPEAEKGCSIIPFSFKDDTAGVHYESLRMVGKDLIYPTGMDFRPEYVEQANDWIIQLFNDEYFDEVI